jgi:hypothetical protein
VKVYAFLSAEIRLDFKLRIGLYSVKPFSSSVLAGCGDSAYNPTLEKALAEVEETT